MVITWVGRRSAAFLLLVGCTPVQPTGDQPPSVRIAAADDASEVAPDQGDRRVITTLQTRDHEITVYGTAQGLRFTVAAAGGTVLAEALSERDFADSFPGLHRRFDSAFADERGPWIDASAEPPPVGLHPH